MKQMFFQSPDRTEQEGVTLKEEQKETLRTLLSEACKLEESPLACRIAGQILHETDWKEVRALVEAIPGQDRCERIHLNFPIRGCVGQVELYSWLDDKDTLCMGLGTSDCSEFALERLRHGQLWALATRFCQQVKAQAA